MRLETFVVVVVVPTILVVVSLLWYKLMHLLLRASAVMIWATWIAVTHLH